MKMFPNILFKTSKLLIFYNFDFQSFAIKAKTKRLERKQNGSLSKKNFDNKEKKIKPSISNNQ
jgi:hypothetical protein